MINKIFLKNRFFYLGGLQHKQYFSGNCIFIVDTRRLYLEFFVPDNSTTVLIIMMPYFERCEHP